MASMLEAEEGKTPIAERERLILEKENALKERQEELRIEAEKLRILVEQNDRAQADIAEREI